MEAPRAVMRDIDRFPSLELRDLAFAEGPVGDRLIVMPFQGTGGKQQDSDQTKSHQRDQGNHEDGHMRASRFRLCPDRTLTSVIMITIDGE
jgi:hypothetical protein